MEALTLGLLWEVWTLEAVGGGVSLRPFLLCTRWQSYLTALCLLPGPCTWVALACSVSHLCLPGGVIIVETNVLQYLDG